MIRCPGTSPRAANPVIKVSMNKLLHIIDGISEWTGKHIAMWLCIGIILIIGNEVVRRYVFNAPTMWGYEISLMAGAGLYVMGYAYTHLHHGHIRVDFVYIHLPPRWRVIIDVLGDLFLFFPLITVLTYASITGTWQSIVQHEVSVETMWYPPMAPFRAVVAIGYFLFLLQGVAELIRNLRLLKGNKLSV